jgi:hypothetical protein
LPECAECREEVARLRASKAAGAGAPELLESALRQAAAWERGHDPAAVQAAVAEGVRPYVGDRAAERLAHGEAPDGGRLLADVEPVLALFLGRRAAAQLVSHVLDRALVKG